MTGRGAGPARCSSVVACGLMAALGAPSPLLAVDEGSAGAPPPIRILHADRLPLDRGQEVLVLEGHVRIAKGTTTLSGEYLKWTRPAQLLELRGDVVVKDKDFRLSSEHLHYDLVAEAATAWGRPRLAQEAGDVGGREILMRAVQLRLFPKEGRVEALEDVEVEQMARSGSESTLEMRVTCRVAEVLSRGRRNIFKGDVRVETTDIGATSGRMLYEQESRRVYLLDGARVWNYDSSGEKLDELRGDKVIYFLDEARTIALGGVRASVHPEGHPGPRTLLRTRRARGE